MRNFSAQARVGLQLLRPQQYLKNGFVFAGIIFSARWDKNYLLAASGAFFSFCCAASAIYIVNDIFDLESDRVHPVKCQRPIARGAIQIHTAWRGAGLLSLSALGIAAVISNWAVIFIALYQMLNFGYSYYWKEIAVLDVFIIATGFMLRLLIGTTGIGIYPTSWLLLCGMMLTLLLGFAKRRAELFIFERVGISPPRLVLTEYTATMLDQFIAISATATILSYGLYTVSNGVELLIITVPLVIYGIFRYLLLLYRQQGGEDAARDFYRDRHLLIIGSTWLGIVIYLLA